MKRRRNWKIDRAATMLRLIAATATVGGAVERSYAERKYGVLDLGPNVIPQGINNLGRVAGFNAGTASGVFRTAPYSAVNNSTDGIADAAVGAEGYRINDAGTVVGEYIYTPTTQQHAFISSGSGFTDIGATMSSGRSSARDINNDTTVQTAGYADTTSPRGFIYESPTSTIVLGTLGGDRSFGFGINNSGQVTGWSLTSSSVAHAFLTGADGSGMTDLGTLFTSAGDATSQGTDVNGAGHVVGYSLSLNASARHGFYYNGAALQDIGVLDETANDSGANAVNSSNEVVGDSFIDSENQHAIRWTPDDGLQDLNDYLCDDSGWTLRYASDINNLGEIVGVGLAPDLSGHGFMLIPIKQGEWNVDASGNWTTDSNWLGDVPNKEGAIAIFGDVITAVRTVTLDQDITVGEIHFDNSHTYTLAGTNTLTLNNLDCEALVEVASGSHTISAPVFLRGDTEFNIVPGTSVLDVTGTISTYPIAGPSAVTIDKNGSGKLLVNFIRAKTLNVNAGTVEIRANSTSTGVSKVQTLTVGTTAKLNLQDNKLVTASAVGSWNGSAYTGVTGLIKSGHNGGGWGGYGIVTSQTHATTSNFTSIGIATAAEAKGISGASTAFWGGQIVTAADTLVMYTYGGDANLDGKINIDDYTRMDNGGGQPGWSNGDFNYDGKVNIDDYVIIDNNIGAQGTAFSTSASISPTPVSAVPEPSTIASIYAALMVRILTRQRRRRLVNPL